MRIIPLVQPIVNFDNSAFVAPIINHGDGENNIEPAPPVSATPAVTPTVTPTISVTPTLTPSHTISVSPTSTPAASPAATPTPTPQVSPSRIVLRISLDNVPTYGSVGIPYNGTVGSSAGYGPKQFTTWLNDLPDGLVMDTATGVITGSPTVAGIFEVGIQVEWEGQSSQGITTIEIVD